jgi:hypothetical protein
MGRRKRTDDAGVAHGVWTMLWWCVGCGRCRRRLGATSTEEHYVKATLRVAVAALLLVLFPAIALASPERRTALGVTRTPASLSNVGQRGFFCKQRLTLSGTYGGTLTDGRQFSYEQLRSSTGQPESVLDLQWPDPTHLTLQRAWHVAIFLPGRLNHPGMKADLATTKNVGVELSLNSDEKAYAAFLAGDLRNGHGPYGSGTVSVSRQSVARGSGGFPTFRNDVTGTITATMSGYSGVLPGGARVKTHGTEHIKATFNCAPGAT